MVRHLELRGRGGVLNGYKQKKKHMEPVGSHHLCRLITVCMT